MKTLESSLYMFTAPNGNYKIPFALPNFTTAAPLTGNADGGTILYGVGVPVAGIQVRETIGAVSELVEAWFKSNHGGGIAS